MKGSALATMAVIILVGCVAVTTAQFPTNITEIIKGYGYPVEQYTAQTPDGYLLSLQRIPYGRTTNRGKGVVFFQHGFCDSAVGACLIPPNEGLPYILADAGYDVWLGNNRGNGISMKHIKYNTNEPQFWDFTWDEMALYDLPTNIDFVLKTTGKRQLSYIGHSEGTTQAFSGFENSTVASKVNVFIALAPVATIFNTRVALLHWLVNMDAEAIFGLLGVSEFALSQAIRKWLPDICYWDPAICEAELDLLMGPSLNINQSRLQYIMTYEPNPTSVKNMVHWAQGVHKDVFERYDYGSAAANQKAYGQPTPPVWDVSKIPSSLPIALFTGSNDYLADPADVKWLMAHLPTKPVFYLNEPTYAHVDFLWADNAYEKIYPSILSLLQKYNV